jgi:hypothetical protein
MPSTFPFEQVQQRMAQLQGQIAQLQNQMPALGAQYPQQQVQQPAPPPPPVIRYGQSALAVPIVNNYTIRSAANINEVIGQAVEPNTTNVFTNLAKGEIYISQLNMETGNKDINLYKYAPADDSGASPPPEQQALPAPVVDLSGIYEKLDAQDEKLNALTAMIGGLNSGNEPATTTAANAKRGKPATIPDGPAPTDGSK